MVCFAILNIMEGQVQGAHDDDTRQTRKVVCYRGLKGSDGWLYFTNMGMYSKNKFGNRLYPT